MNVIPNSLRSGPNEGGHFGAFGGCYVAETLMPLLLHLEAAYEKAKDDPAFQAELGGLLKHYVGRPNPLYFVEHLTRHLGGAKVYPEEVETIINRHMAVRMSRVAGRSSPIVGSLVVAEVVLMGEPESGRPEAELAALRRQILDLCRETLAPHKVPATVRFVPTLGMATAGKLARAHA